MHRGEILDTSKKLTCGDRNHQYGDPETQLELAGRLHELWLAAGGDKFSPGHNNAIFMVFTKLSRMVHGKIGYLDHYVDAAAYIAIAGQIATKDD